jgi:hypothetical protein
MKKLYHSGLPSNDRYAMMPGMFKDRLFLILVVFSLGLVGTLGTGLAADSLYDEMSRRKEVPIFVAMPTDAGATKLDMALLKTKIEETLRNRKSIHFLPVEDASKALLTVDVQTDGYVFSLEDPIDMLVGAGAVAMDAAKKDPYGSMEATFTVMSAGGEVRFKDKLRGSVTEEKMTEAESPGKVFEKISEVFVRNAFGKKKK